MPDILHRVGIKSSPEKIYTALTEEKGLSGWWTHDTKADVLVGSINKFHFGEEGFNAMEIVELVPAKLVKWKCVDGPVEWIGTELTFDLKPERDRTVVFFAHRGWKEPVEFLHYCSTKWAVFLLSLKSLCEIGLGSPHPHDVSIG